MGDRWYQEAVVYCLDIDTYADSDGDGVGDIRGLIGRLDYLARLGVTGLWLHRQARPSQARRLRLPVDPALPRQGPVTAGSPRVPLG